VSQVLDRVEIWAPGWSVDESDQFVVQIGDGAPEVVWHLRHNSTVVAVVEQCECERDEVEEEREMEINVAQSARVEEKLTFIQLSPS
jgi:hypothetical protein